MPLGHIDEWSELAVDYLDGTASAVDQAAVESHIASCPECAARVRQQTSVQAYLRQTAPLNAPEDLEQRILGELFSPSQVIERAPDRDTRGWASLRQRRLRAWMPAAAAVAALLVFIVIYGVAISPRDQQLTAEKAATTVLATMAASQGSGEMALDASTAGDAGDATTTAAGIVETTAAPATATTAAAITPASLPAGTQNRKAMIAELSDSAGPVYLTLTATSPETSPNSRDDSAGTGSATASDAGDDTRVGPETSESNDTSDTETRETAQSSATAQDRTTDTALPAWVEEAASQLTLFTQMEPLPETLSLGQPVFAGYVKHEQVTHFVDLLLSIAASVDLDVTMLPQVDTGSSRSADRITGSKQQLPVLEGHVISQPAPARVSFTTSTLVAPGRSDTSRAICPDEAGTHVLMILFLRP